MPKRRIDVTIDDDVWFYLRSENINVSKEVNEYLKQYISLKKNEVKELTELKQELKKIEEIAEENRKKRDGLFIQIRKLEEEQEKERAEKMHEAEVMADAFLANNPARFIGMAGKWRNKENGKNL